MAKARKSTFPFKMRANTLKKLKTIWANQKLISGLFHK